MQLNSLTKNSGSTTARRIGRGGKRGKTSGRGHKGQKARAGHKIRPAERDLIKRIPKRRGYGKNRARTVNAGRVRAVAVNIAVLEQVFNTGEQVTPAQLVARHVVRSISRKPPTVKILALGTLTKKLTVAGCAVSNTARAAIEAAGGSVL